MKKYPVLDGHCDTAVELWRKGESLAENSGQISLAQAEEFPAYVQFFCVLHGLDQKCADR